MVAAARRFYGEVPTPNSVRIIALSPSVSLHPSCVAALALGAFGNPFSVYDVDPRHELYLSNATSVEMDADHIASFPEHCEQVPVSGNQGVSSIGLF